MRSRGALAYRSKTVWSILGLAFCYVYVYNFFQTWFHTFLVRGRGFSEANLLLSALPYVVAACANLAGGAASDALVRRLGAKRGRRVIGATALTAAAAFTVAAMLTHHQVLTVVFLALTYGAITFQQSGVFGVCLDIGGPRAGAMVGLMNTIAQVGGLAGSVLYGYIVDRTGSYDAPFIPMTVLLLVGAALWVNVDASREVGGDPPATLADVAQRKLAACLGSGVSVQIPALRRGPRGLRHGSTTECGNSLVSMSARMPNLYAFTPSAVRSSWRAASVAA